jgi:Putative homoserine kinase type II (protein kinase fold)
MKYINGKEIFPHELLDLIQDYAQGQYVYIPKREESRERWGTKTSYKKELDIRNSRIYSKFLTGVSVAQLSMKYNLTKKSIHRILLSKRKEAEKMSKIIDELKSNWDLHEEVHQIYDSTWSIGDKYVLKVNEKLAQLERNITIMRALGESGIPVAKPVKTKYGQDYVEYDGKYYFLMNKLSGSNILNIYVEDYLNIAYETGKIMAQLHKAFIDCEQKITFWNNNLLNEMQGWVCNNLKSNQFKYLTEEDFNSSLEELTGCYEKLPRQLIHRDFSYGNILFQNGRLSGYVDFDLSQKNIRIFDSCYFLIGLLVNHEKTKEDVEKWYYIVSKFFEGYEQISPLLQLEKDSICCVMKSIELLFVAYFLGLEDEDLGKSAADLFYFIKNNEKEINDAVNKKLMP